MLPTDVATDMFKSGVPTKHISVSSHAVGDGGRYPNKRNHARLHWRFTITIPCSPPLLLPLTFQVLLVTLHWEVKCPVCNSLDLHPQCLADLRTHHTCPACQHTHTTIADEQVQVTFSIDERLRKLGAEAQDLNFRAAAEARYGTTSGHALLTLQAFRNLFPRETLLPNESLLVRRVAILFTDLAGSTALYARRGDTRAYNLVRQHFEILFRVIDEHHGVVVKTIGDAVMGAFTVPMQALQAAIAMHHRMAQLNQQLSLLPEDQLILKVGIDAGPCLNVSLNERLDYFGITVNTAARVQATSSGHNIAVTNAITADLEPSFFIPDWTWQKENLMLKGIDNPVVVHYLQRAEGKKADSS